MTALATLEQLTDRITTTVDPDRAAAALDDVSAAVRSYTGQTISAAINTERLRVHGYKVRLSQRPVTDVATVVDIDGNDVGYLWDGLDIVALRTSTVRAFDYDQLVSTTVVDVTYDSGYDVVPDDIVAVVCNVAARALAEGPEMSGVTQESVANYSVSFGAIGASGPLGFFTAETRVLDRYRRPGVAWQGAL